MSQKTIGTNLKARSQKSTESKIHEYRVQAAI